LSTEQLVGLNGAVFGDKALVGIAWEALAAFAMITTALVFLPHYLASGFTTTPAFLEKRFDKTTRNDWPTQCSSTSKIFLCCIVRFFHTVNDAIREYCYSSGCNDK
jgi:uncharacterized sodium:solute symporter family permease YidK